MQLAGVSMLLTRSAMTKLKTPLTEASRRMRSVQVSWKLC